MVKDTLSDGQKKGYNLTDTSTDRIWEQTSTYITDIGTNSPLKLLGSVRIFYCLFIVGLLYSRVWVWSVDAFEAAG